MIRLQKRKGMESLGANSDGNGIGIIASDTAKSSLDTLANELLRSLEDENIPQLLANYQAFFNFIFVNDLPTSKPQVDSLDGLKDGKDSIDRQVLTLKSLYQQYANINTSTIYDSKFDVAIFYHWCKERWLQ